MLKVKCFLYSVEILMSTIIYIECLTFNLNSVLSLIREYFSFYLVISITKSAFFEYVLLLIIQFLSIISNCLILKTCIIRSEVPFRRKHLFKLSNPYRSNSFIREHSLFVPCFIVTLSSWIHLIKLLRIIFITIFVFRWLFII
jgi:hypothetical protein